jgi:predicted MPP superfamily phosphohydrolase
MTQYWPFIVCAIILTASAFILLMRREARNIALETVSVGTGADPLRVVQLTDVHIRFNNAPAEKIIPLINEAAPHIIILTGDYIGSAAEVERFLTWMENLIRNAPGVVFYMCFGNHDNRAFRRSPALGREFEKSLKKLGVFIMENRTLTYTHKGKVYAFTGYSDARSAPPRDVRAAYRDLPKKTAYHIGFSHNPDLALKLSGPRPELFICGHFHGGQIRLPFHLEYTCLRSERLCKMGIRSGLHKFNGRDIYISRGLGCVLVPLRFCARPEITLFLVP